MNIIDAFKFAKAGGGIRRKIHPSESIYNVSIAYGETLSGFLLQFNSDALGANDWEVVVENKEISMIWGKLLADISMHFSRSCPWTELNKIPHNAKVTIKWEE